MACVLVPLFVAGVATAVKSMGRGKAWVSDWKVGWLTTMLWGGGLLLGVEHVVHGEIVPYFPFLTAMATPAETAVMVQEMATTGVLMTLAVFALWLGMVLVHGVVEKRKRHAIEA